MPRRKQATDEERAEAERLLAAYRPPADEGGERRRLGIRGKASGGHAVPEETGPDEEETVGTD